MSEKRRDSKGRILRNGEVQRADGKYMFRYIDSDGKRHSVYSWKLVETDKVPESKRSQIALRDLEKQIQRDIDDGIRTAAANTVTVDRQFKAFMDLRVDLKETTRCNYICLYSKHVQPYMVHGLGLKVSTVQSVHSILYQLFEGATMDKIIRANPAENVVKSLKKMLNVKPDKRHPLTEEEQSRLIDFVYNSNQYKKWSTLFTVLLGTGMRIGEALGLRWCDCDFKKGLIQVDHTLLYKQSEGGGYEYRISEPKTTAGLRIIPMFLDVSAALLREKEKRQVFKKKPFIVDGYTDFIFLNSKGKVYTPGAVYDTIQRITNTYNREEYFRSEKGNREPCYLPKFSAHILRHTFCTRMCENEPNIKVIQDVMGHKSSRTTMDIYNEATQAKKISSFQSLEGKIKLA